MVKPPNLEVRPCAAADVPVVTATEVPGADIATRQFARQERGESVYLVAWVGQRPIGSGELLWSDPPELRNLHVDEQWQGRGVGTALIAEAERRCEGRSAIMVGVGLDNRRARRLYERLGFRGTGEYSTTTYTYVDATGPHEATETDEALVKHLP